MAHVSLGFRFWCRICSQDGKKHRGRRSPIATQKTGCGCGWSRFLLSTLRVCAPFLLTGGCPRELESVILRFATRLFEFLLLLRSVFVVPSWIQVFMSYLLKTLNFEVWSSSLNELCLRFESVGEWTSAEMSLSVESGGCLCLVVKASCQPFPRTLALFLPWM